MDEDELEDLKKERMEKLQGSDSEDQPSMEDQMEERRQQIKSQAAQYLTSEARSRLGNLRAARPELASTIEMQVARMGKAGQIDKMNDQKLKRILKDIQKTDEDDTNISFRR